MSEPHAKDEAKVWGCLECGSFVERLTPEGECPVCEHGLVVELGGHPSADKAQALIAWARRDATDLIKNRGTIVGAVAGFVGGLIVAFFGTELGASSVLVLLYTAVLGALIGRLLALRVHLLIRPDRQLQPIHDEKRRKQVVVALFVWALLPVVALIVLSVAGGPGGLSGAGRRILGVLWSKLTGG